MRVQVEAGDSKLLLFETFLLFLLFLLSRTSYRGARAPKKKVSDRFTENPEDNLFLETRIWIRYRGRAINGVKGNFKNSQTDDMKCRFCPRVPKETVEDHVENEINPELNQNYSEETQEHLEICKGTDHKRRGLNMSKWQGILKFWMRMSTRLSNLSVKQRNKKGKT